jgi:hypothetical protein
MAFLLSPLTEAFCPRRDAALDVVPLLADLHAGSEPVSPAQDVLLDLAAVAPGAEAQPGVQAALEAAQPVQAAPEASDAGQQEPAAPAQVGRDAQVPACQVLVAGARAAVPVRVAPAAAQAAARAEQVAISSEQPASPDLRAASLAVQARALCLWVLHSHAAQVHARFVAQVPPEGSVAPPWAVVRSDCCLPQAPSRCDRLESASGPPPPADDRDSPSQSSAGSAAPAVRVVIAQPSADCAAHESPEFPPASALLGYRPARCSSRGSRGCARLDDRTHRESPCYSRCSLRDCTQNGPHPSARPHTHTLYTRSRNRSHRNNRPDGPRIHGASHTVRGRSPSNLASTALPRMAHIPTLQAPSRSRPNPNTNNPASRCSPSRDTSVVRIPAVAEELHLHTLPADHIDRSHPHLRHTDQNHPGIDPEHSRD